MASKLICESEFWEILLETFDVLWFSKWKERESE